MADTDFKHSPLLVGLTEEQVESLLATGEHRSYVDGTIIVEQNAPSDCLYILTGGAAQVEQSRRWSDRSPGSVRPGRRILRRDVSYRNDATFSRHQGLWTHIGHGFSKTGPDRCFHCRAAITDDTHSEYFENSVPASARGGCANC